MTFKIPPYLKDAQIAYDGNRFKVVTTYQIGKSGKKRHREIVVHPGAVLILPILADGRIVMIRNKRIAVDKFIWELPAGTLEIDEPPIECAKRELLEETGYRSDNISHLIDFFTSPGICNERMYVFVAKDLALESQQLEDGEEILVECLTWKQIDEMIASREIEDAKTLVALLLYKSTSHA